MNRSSLLLCDIVGKIISKYPYTSSTCSYQQFWKMFTKKDSTLYCITHTAGLRSSIPSVKLLSSMNFSFFQVTMKSQGTPFFCAAMCFPIFRPITVAQLVFYMTIINEHHPNHCKMSIATNIIRWSFISISPAFLHAHSIFHWQTDAIRNRLFAPRISKTLKLLYFTNGSSIVSGIISCWLIFNWKDYLSYQKQ